MYVLKHKTQELYIGKKQGWNGRIFVTNINRAQTYSAQGMSNISLNSPSTKWLINNSEYDLTDFEPFLLNIQ